MGNKRKVHIPTVKTRNHMLKNAEWRWIILPCIIVLIGSIIILYQWIGERNSTVTNIEYIRSFMTSTGKLNDFSNKINMDDPTTDIRWEWNEKGEIKIMFGRIILDWENVEDFLDPDIQTKLGTIGFTTEVVKKRYTDDITGANREYVITIYWKDNVVERCVGLDFLGD